MGFYYVEVCSFYTCSMKSFYHKWILNFVNSFFCIHWENNMDFIFQFVNAVYCIDWLAYVKESLHSWDKVNLIMMYDHFNMLLGSVC